MPKKLLDFQTSISDVEQVNPLFSTCKVRILYTGKNRNMSSLSKETVEKALPTLKNIPIVGEFSVEANDFKGHGGSIDLDSYKFIHTTKPYGVVPESATFEWEQVGDKEYLTVYGCYLWTGRYEEAYEVVTKGKGQSMEIEVINGEWQEKEEVYRIDNFIFSALTILGSEIEPCFEGSQITAYSLDKDTFKKEYSQMLEELKFSLTNETENIKENKKEGCQLKLEELLEKYSTTVEELTEKGINFNEISEDELEAKVAEVFKTDNAEEPKDETEEENPNEDAEKPEDHADDEEKESEEESEDKQDEDLGEEDSDEEKEGSNEDGEGEQAEFTVEEDISKNYEIAKAKVVELETQLDAVKSELEQLKEFKLHVEKEKHETAVNKLFTDFQLTEEDVKDIDIHTFSLVEIEEKCFAILGRKLAKKNFEKSKEKDSIRLPLNTKGKENQPSPYGGLFDKYSK